MKYLNNSVLWCANALKDIPDSVLETEMPSQELKLCFPYVEYVLGRWDVGNFSI